MLVSEVNITRCVSAAKEAVLLAGASILKHGRFNKKINTESMRDIKIAADFESEQIIIDYLKEKTNFSILSEEQGLVLGDEQHLTWIVDPLDGSLNYARGIPFSCVSIGLWQGESPLLGVVYEFRRSELFWGIVEKGAWLNDSPLKLSSIRQKEKAVLCTGFPANTDFSEEGIRRFIENIRSYKKVRLLGSAALSIVYVACGRTDAYYEQDIMLWDVAGAIPILLGAKGKLRMRKAAEMHSYHIYVSNGYF